MMRGAVGLLIFSFCACSRETPSDDVFLDGGQEASISIADGSSSDGSTPGSDIIDDRAATDDAVYPADTISDVSQPGADVGGPDLRALDAVDVQIGTDGKLSDRCGNAFSRASVWPASASWTAVVTSEGASDASGDTPADFGDANEAGARDGSDDGRGHDASDEENVESQCDDLQKAWGAFVLQSRDCSGGAGCVLVGGAGSCNCYPGGLGHPLGNPSGDAISGTAQSQAQIYLSQWSQLGCNAFVKFCVLDAGPAKNVRCEQGSCVADSTGCFVIPPSPEPCR